MEQKGKTGGSKGRTNDASWETLPAVEHEAQTIISLLIGVLWLQSLLLELSQLSPDAVALSNSLTPKMEALLSSVWWETGLSRTISTFGQGIMLNFTFKGSSTISSVEAITSLETEMQVRFPLAP
jgi:hypothetical protein